MRTTGLLIKCREGKASCRRPRWIGFTLGKSPCRPARSSTTPRAGFMERATAAIPLLMKARGGTCYVFRPKSRLKSSVALSTVFDSILGTEAVAVTG